MTEGERTANPYLAFVMDIREINTRIGEMRQDIVMLRETHRTSSIYLNRQLKLRQ